MSDELKSFFNKSGLRWVLVGFSIVVFLNLLTLYAGPARVLLGLGDAPWEIIPASFIFDSWGTIGGLLGVVFLFSPILAGTSGDHRVRLSVFFLGASILVGIAASILWNSVYNVSGPVPFGSSSIAMSAQSIIFALALVGLTRLIIGSKDKESPSGLDRYTRYSLAIEYAALIVTTIWFIAILQPILLPSLEYNWRVHQIAFVLGMLAALVYSVLSRGKDSRPPPKNLFRP